MGPVLETYLAWSKNTRLRFDASSGGFVTQLLLDLMELKLIDGAIVTIPDDKRPYLARTIIAEDSHKILEAKGSKYTISSPGLLIKELFNRDGRYAVVGLPCHILMFKKAEKLFPKLKNKIALHIGLFCGHTAYPTLYYWILYKELKPKSNKKIEVTSIRYRGSGWPGYLEITLSDGTKLRRPYDYWISTYFSSMLFTPYRCLLCNDSTAELADIAVGDPWIDFLKKKDRMGKSLVVIRSTRGKRYFMQAAKVGSITYIKIPNKIILHAQKTNIVFKKMKIKYRLRFSKSEYSKHIGYENIYKQFDIQESAIENLLSSVSSIILMLTLHNNFIKNVVVSMPKHILRFFSKFIFLTLLYSSTYNRILASGR